MNNPLNLDSILIMDVSKFNILKSFPGLIMNETQVGTKISQN